MEPLPGSFVVLANVFNPSVVSQAWLLTNQLVDQAEFGKVSISTPQIAQHEIGSVFLLAAPDRLQVSFPGGDGAAISRAAGLAQAIVDKLPHTPYTSLGMNFEYGVELPETTIAATVRGWFLGDRNPLASQFEAEDARFGSYFSKGYEGMRLRVSILPVILTGGGQRREALRFQFNFHRDVNTANPQEAAREAAETLSAWQTYRGEAVRLVEVVEKHATGPV
jgi:hypothetical protein